RPPPSSTLFPYTTLFRSPSIRVHLGYRDTYARAQCSDLVRSVRLVNALPLSRIGASSRYKKAAQLALVASLGARDTHVPLAPNRDRKSTRLNSSHVKTSY